MTIERGFRQMLLGEARMRWIRQEKCHDSSGGISRKEGRTRPNSNQVQVELVSFVPDGLRLETGDWRAGRFPASGAGVWTRPQLAGAA